MSNADLAEFAPKPALRTTSPAREMIAPTLAWGLVLAALAFALPQFETVFRDFGVEAGWGTMLFIKASHLTLAVLGGVVVLLVADSILRDLLAARFQRQWPVRAWATLMFALPLATLSALIVSLGATLIGLISKLSG